MSFPSTKTDALRNLSVLKEERKLGDVPQVVAHNRGRVILSISRLAGHYNVMTTNSSE